MSVVSDDTVSSDIKLETETEDGGVGEDVPTSLPANMYHPRRALRNAIVDWLPEFGRVKQAWGPITKPQPALPIPLPLPVILPSVNTCMSVTTTTTTTAATTGQNTNQLQALAEVCSTVRNANILYICYSLISSSSYFLLQPIHTFYHDLKIEQQIPPSSYQNLLLFLINRFGHAKEFLKVCQALLRSS